MNELSIGQSIIIDGIDAGDYVFYEQISPTEIALYISNREAEIYNITITENDIMKSIRQYFGG